LNIGNKIGKDGLEFIFKLSVKLHGNKAKELHIIVHITVHILKLLKIAKNENIKLRRSFIKKIKEIRIQLRFFRHPKKLKKALGAMKRLKQIAMIILRDIDRKFYDNLELHKKYAESFYFFNRVLKQEKNTPNKIYSLHEIDAYVIIKIINIRCYCWSIST
jgi:IS5 family transposase